MSTILEATDDKNRNCIRSYASLQKGMQKPLFRVKRYSHPKYKFLARAKVLDKWHRRYFRSEIEAIAFAEEQNRQAHRYLNSAPPGTPRLSGIAPDAIRTDLSALVVPIYMGPRIERFFGEPASMHLPFVYEAIAELKPRVLVELGVRKGELYFAFCQSVVDHGLETECCGIDSWQGVAARDEPGAAAEVQSYNERYSAFSQLKTLTFPDALSDFVDGSIDLLHIDVAGVYADVRRIFESWLPKVSRQGVVLLQNVNRRDSGCEVGQLWDEIAGPKRSFLFEFGYGLGVWKKDAVAKGDPPLLRRLFRATAKESKQINEYYATAAAALALWRAGGERAERKAEEVSAHEAALQERDKLAAELGAAEASLEASRTELEQAAQQNAATGIQLKAARAALEASQAEATRQVQASHHATTELELVRTRMTGMETALATWKGRFSALQEAFNASQTDLTQISQQGRLKDAQINTLHTAITEAHAQWNSAIAQVNVERSENRELRKRAEAIEAALKSSIERARADAGQLQAALAEERSRKEDLRTLLEAKAEQIAGLEVELLDLNIAVKAARSQWNQLGAELRAAQFQNGELQAQCELDAEQIEALENSRRELSSALDQRQSEFWRLSGVVDIQKSLNEGLRRNAARLTDNLKELAGGMLADGTALHKEDGWLGSIVNQISKDIRRIAHPSFGWRIAYASGLLRLAPAAIPRTLRERRAVAKDLKAGRDDICRALSSPHTPPHEIASEIARLFQLRRQAHELVKLLKITHLLRRNPASWNITHWAQQSAGRRFAATPASALFDAAWYLSEYPDIAASGIDPLHHYVNFGVRELRNPNPVFDTNWYLTRTPPLAPAKVNPLEHYWRTGTLEDRDPNPLFDADWYLALNPDVEATGLNPLLHYLTYGMREGRHPHPLFDATWYCTMYPEVAGLNPLEHYLKWGGRHGLSPHPLFHTAWYLREHRDVAEAGSDPLVHYLEYGAAEGRSPHPLFDAQWYLHETGNLPEAAANPLRHYVLTGARARYSPCPLFDPHFYAEQFPESADCEDLFRHYLTIGWRLGYRPSPSFDPRRYLRRNPDVALRGLEPLTHSVARA